MKYGNNGMRQKNHRQEKNISRRRFLEHGAIATISTAAPISMLAISPALGENIQRPSTGFQFNNQNPAYKRGKGPVVMVHRAVSPYVRAGALGPFEHLVKTDGFQFIYSDQIISSEMLEMTDILCVANAYRADYDNFTVLDAPQVYTKDEVELIRKWVEDGGALLLLADHSPFAGGTVNLAAAFDFTFVTGHSMAKHSLSERLWVHIDFQREGYDNQEIAKYKLPIGKLNPHAIVDGGSGRKKINHFYAFGGQAIIPAEGAYSLFEIPTDFEALLANDVTGEFYSAPRLDVSGMSQGAVMEYGKQDATKKGRLAIFGETGGFTSQSIDGAEPFGFEDPFADQNAEFVLSVLRWLARFEA